MKNIEISILNCENQLLASRKQLNDLIYEFDNQKINHSFGQLQELRLVENHNVTPAKAKELITVDCEM